MKTLAKRATLLIVFGLCLPSYADILVYKVSASYTDFEYRDGEWRVTNPTYKGYWVMDFNYGTHHIDQQRQVDYWKKANTKLFSWGDPEWEELVRVEYGTKIQWVLMSKGGNAVGEQIANPYFGMLTGSVRERNIGVGVNRKVAASLNGYVLHYDPGEEDRGEEIRMARISLTFYPAWTSWANGPQGHMDFDTTAQMIEDNLKAKGYADVDD